jgi:hypothetical protein
VTACTQAAFPNRLERPTGKLRRSVLLPGPHDRTQIRTRIRDGVLEIRVPKRDDVGLTKEFRVEEQPQVRWSACSQRVRGTSLTAAPRPHQCICGPFYGGASRTRTGDLLGAIMVDLGRREARPAT